MSLIYYVTVFPRNAAEATRQAASTRCGPRWASRTRSLSSPSPRGRRGATSSRPGWVRGSAADVPPEHEVRLMIAYIGVFGALIGAAAAASLRVVP